MDNTTLDNVEPHIKSLRLWRVLNVKEKYVVFLQEKNKVNIGTTVDNGHFWPTLHNNAGLFLFTSGIYGKSGIFFTFLSFRFMRVTPVN